MKILSIIILTLTITVISCVPYRYLAKHHNEICTQCINEFVQNKDTTPETKIDTFKQIIKVTSPLDKHLQTLYFRCDSSNRVIMFQIDNVNGNYLKYKQLYNGVTLNLQVYQDSIDFYKEQLRIEKTITKPPVIINNPPVEIKVTPWWCYLVIGILSLAFIILGIAIIKLYKK